MLPCPPLSGICFACLIPICIGVIKGYLLLAFQFIKLLFNLLQFGPKHFVLLVTGVLLLLKML